MKGFDVPGGVMVQLLNFTHRFRETYLKPLNSFPFYLFRKSHNIIQVLLLSKRVSMTHGLKVNSKSHICP